MTGIYIHWPFCQSKCPYCDFNSHVRQSISEIDWEIAYKKVLNYWAQNCTIQSVESIFFGGGTPSLMSASLVYRIINEIHKIWSCKPNIEITLEANPTSVESLNFRSYAQSGVNRVSMGVQALNNKDLKRLGRLHTVDDAKNAFEIAKSVFDRVSFDLIYARQFQTVSDWQLELEEALNMSVDHLSLYQLTIEKNTRFSELHSKGKLKGLPNDDISVEFYNVTQEICSDWGLPAYEISNHAKLGSESQHNLIYWTGGYYLGVGPGAHGRLKVKNKRFRTEMFSNPEKWLKTVTENKFSEFLTIPLSDNEIAEEYLLMGIRLEVGIDVTYFNTYSDQKLSTKKVKLLSDMGLIVFKNNRLFTTKKGKLVTNYIINELLVF